MEESGRAGVNCYGGQQGKTLVFQNQDSFEDQPTFQLYFPSASDWINLYFRSNNSFNFCLYFCWAMKGNPDVRPWSIEVLSRRMILDVTIKFIRFRCFSDRTGILDKIKKIQDSRHWN